jgi:hypothetical protein
MREAMSMWMKDMNGNWYNSEHAVSSKKMNECQGYWQKDSYGNWYCAKADFSLIRATSKMSLSLGRAS